MKLVYPAIFSPCEEGGYTVTVPDLPGCISEGNTLIESIEMGTDAACGWILGELEEGHPIPEPTPFEKVVLEESDSFINLLVLDIDSYSERFGKKAVRKNITIPAWLNEYGERNNINFSKVLQDSLLSMTKK